MKTRIATEDAKPDSVQRLVGHPIHVISLGAGVQSSTMALMAARGEIVPNPVAAIFADTGDEPKRVYEWLSELTEMLNIPVQIVKNENGRLSKPENLFRGDHSQIPAFMLTDCGVTIGKRQCTREFKVRPIRRAIKQITNGEPATQLIGITTDEISRAKDNDVAWLTNKHPLLEKRMSRRDCLNWLSRQGIVNVPKSACTFCPYHSNPEWAAFKKEDGASWNQILEVDAALNERGEYLHSSCKPIKDVDFSTEEERGQLNMFNNECEGMCGV